MVRRASNVTRDRIQSVALALFGTRGYAASSLQDIAVVLEVTKAALYYHFPSKAELLHSLVDPFLDAERALLDQYGDGPLDSESRRTLIRSLIDVLLAHRPIVAWLTQDIAAQAQPEVGTRVAANADRLQRLLGGGSGDGAGQVRAAAAIGALTRPFAALPEVNLSILHDTVALAALGALGSE